MTTSRIVLTRLGLICACAAALFLAAVVWRYFGWPTAVTITLGGSVLAVVLSIDSRPAADKQVIGVAQRDARKGQRVTVDLDADETFRRLG